MNIETSKEQKKGITLIEILLLLVVLAIFVSIIISIFSIWKKPPPPIRESEKILMIKNAMEFYKADNGDYPTTAQGIAALVVKPVIPPIPKHWRPYLKTMPYDSSGKPYQYIYPDKNHGIYCLRLER